MSILVLDRVMGIENEFGTLIGEQGGKYDSASEIGANDLGMMQKEWMIIEELKNKHRMALWREQQKIIRQCGVLYQDSEIDGSIARIWFPSGGCLYYDTGNHPEYATPECRRVRDLVLYNKAGEILSERTLNKLWRVRHEQSRIILVKNNFGFSPNELKRTRGERETFGCHENYLIRGMRLPTDFNRNRSILTQGRLISFFPFLITRQIFDGAGTWDEKGKYYFSQRGRFIFHEVEIMSTDDRSILNVKDENLLYPREFRGNKAQEEYTQTKRLQAVLGDANMLEMALFLKIGTMSLALTLLEHEKAPRFDVEDSLGAMHKINASYDPKARIIKMREGRPKSALDIQKKYLECAEAFVRSPEVRFESEESLEEAKLICRRWRDALNALEKNDISWLVGRVDHVTKKYLAEREILRMETKDGDSRVASIKKEIDFAYHQIGNRGLYEHIKDIWPEKRILKDEEIEKAVEDPPSGTRAHMRGNLVKYASCLGRSRPSPRGKRFSIKHIGWDSVVILTGLEKETTIPLEPLQVTSPLFERLCPSRKIDDATQKEKDDAIIR